MKILLNDKDFKATNKAELIELYKEMYDKYFRLQTDFREAQIELKTLRQAEAARTAKKTAPKQYAHDASKAFERINKNPRVVGKPMTVTQLKLILTMMSERDYGFGTEVLVNKTTIWANALINKMIKEKSKYPKRTQRYDPEELYGRFIRKYPEWYKELGERNL